MQYVDERGEHSGSVSDEVAAEEQRSRLRTIANDRDWLHTAVLLGDELLNLARRSGDTDAWGCTSGYYGGSNPGPNVMMQTIKSVTGRRPPKPARGPFVRPQSGRWSVRQVFAYDAGEEAPSVAIWHLGFTQNPQFFPRWCEAISAGSGPPCVLILPDSPISRDLVRRWRAGERHKRHQGWRGDAIRDYRGTAAYARPRVSAALEVDGTEIAGDTVVAAISFLRARYQLHISPFDLLRDPLLAAQLGSIENDDLAWLPSELANLDVLRQKFDKPQRLHAWRAEITETAPDDVFGEEVLTVHREEILVVQELFPRPDSTPRPPRVHSGGVRTCIRAIERAMRSGELAPIFISGWTGWAPSALERGHHPEVPAQSGWYGRVAHWYRETFAAAVRYGLIDEHWYGSRERWHAEAYRAFSGNAEEYREHISLAEQALGSESERQRLSRASDVPDWYRRVFAVAEQLDVVRTGP